MFYIYDTTEKNSKGEMAVKLFTTTEKLVSHLEKISPKLLGQTRSQLMSNAADLGFGEDDREGKTFYQFLSEYLDMGIIRKDGQPVRCDIFTAQEYRHSEYGD